MTSVLSGVGGSLVVASINEALSGDRSALPAAGLRFAGLSLLVLTLRWLSQAQFVQLNPMYAAGLVLVAGIPLALGSFWGLLTLVPFVALIIYRLRDEETLLARELPGYEEYRARTRYRLVPHVW